MGKGRAPCCAKVGLNRGSWTPEEDMRLIAYIQKYGHANWRALPKQAGLLRCGKSCRLRWINYLRPDLKRGNFTAEEEETIIKLHGMLGNKWSKIAACLPGRTDNEIKNVWNTHLKKRVAPCGEDAKKKKKKKKKPAAGAEETAPSPSPSPSPSSSTMTTTNCPSGDTGEQQSNPSNQELDLTHLEIPMLDTGFDFDMLVDDPVPEMMHCPPSVSVPTSPCASSTSPPAPPPPRGVDDLLELPPGMEIDQELWSIIDGDGVFNEAPPAACHGNATDANDVAATSQQEEGKEWWLENLERELGLWGPVEDYQYPTTSPLGLADPDPLPAMVPDPVSSYFEVGPNAATSFQQGPELTSN